MGLSLSSKTNHICTISKHTSKSFLPPLAPDANFFQKFKRGFKKLTLISENNPRSTEFFRSHAEIMQIRKEQVKSNSIIIHPFSMFRAIYEMWMAIVFMCSLVYMPVDAAFDEQRFLQNKSFLYIDMALSNLCLIDIVMTFFTGYAVPSKRKVVMDPKKIAQHYVFGIYFITDLLSSIPDLEAIRASHGLKRTVDILKLLKIIRLPTLFFYMIRTAELFRKCNTVFRVCKFNLITYIVVHWFACIHFMVPQVRYLFNGKYHQNSWLLTQELIGREFSTQYIQSMYKASGYLLGVNTGMGLTDAWEELLLAILTYLFGKIFVLTLTVIYLRLLLNQRELETKYCETMSQVCGYMRQKKLPIPMQKRLIQYYDYKYNMKYFKENVITGLLSDKLKKEINVHMCKRLIQNVTLFNNLHPKTLEDILTHLRAEIFLPNDIIIKAGAVGDCMYFLASGTVAVSTPSGKEICHLQDGAYFGEVCLLFKDKKRTATIVAIEICEVYKLERKAFKNSFLTNPDLLKKLESEAQIRMDITDLMEDTHMKSLEMLSRSNKKNKQKK